MDASGPDAELLQVATDAAVAAGEATLRYRGADAEVRAKQDGSPLTEADRAAHREIVSILQARAPGQPIVSEEGDPIEYDQRSRWSELWLVDPLDGTKEFVQGTGEYTVNIALIRNGAPALGVVYAPVAQVLYRGGARLGAEMLTDPDDDHAWSARVPLPCVALDRRVATVAASRRHGSDATETFIRQLQLRFDRVSVVRLGSAIKICRVAEGVADFYPRFAPTMEWDTAAGDAILRAAGGMMISASGGDHLAYNKQNLLNPDFVAVAPGRDRPPTLRRSAAT